jgi:manganese transport protein
MDPGNWATDLQGGAKFGYQLIWVLLMSNIMAVLLQTLSARLGVVTGKDLAQACRDFYPRPLVYPLWILCEVAIVACDLAEVLGAAIGLKLLFGTPLLWGVLITALDVLVLLGLSRLGMRRMEAFIIVLVATIGACFGIEILLSKPDFLAIAVHFLPRGEDGSVSFFSFTPGGGLSVLGLHDESLYIAIGILGATVMPHNLYLHSSLVQTRDVGASKEGKRQACRMNLVDSVVALNCAFFVNAAILVLAGAVFHTSGHQEVARLEEAHGLLAPLLGTTAASVLFAIALLCAGQSSTITGTLAGQIVMEGFLQIRIRPWLRRVISRGLAIVPAVLVIWFQGDSAVDDLLVLSQVILSLQLSFAVIPLITFTSDRARMGDFVNPKWVVAVSIAVAAVIVGLNSKLAAETISGWFTAAGPNAAWLGVVVLPVVAGIGLLLLYVTLAPFLEPIWPWLVRRVEEAPAIPAIVNLPAPSVASAPLYRRIAVAIEMGPADHGLLEHVWRMLESSGAEVVLLHVAESAAGRYLGPEALDKESREDRAALENLAEQFQKRGVRATAMLGYGDAKSELARLVNASGADLLVTGSHGHRLILDLLYGATASGVRHLVRIPVMTVPSSGRGE